MPKKVYRSLFDADDVYEVEELTDNPDISTSGIAEVKTEDAGGPAAGHTIEECWDAIQGIKDSLEKLTAKSKVKDGNEPATEMKVEEQEIDIDSSKPVNANDSDDEDEEEEEVEVKASKDVKDAYSPFTRAGAAKKADPAVATQVAFQKRYDSVANKG